MRILDSERGFKLRDVIPRADFNHFRARLVYILDGLVTLHRAKTQEYISSAYMEVTDTKENPGPSSVAAVGDVTMVDAPAVGADAHVDATAHVDARVDSGEHDPVPVVGAVAHVDATAHVDARADSGERVSAVAVADRVGDEGAGPDDPRVSEFGLIKMDVDKKKGLRTGWRMGRATR